MRTWLYWLSHTSVAVGGAFVAASTFIWRHATAEVSPRWLTFGIGVAAAAIGLGALADRAYDVYRAGFTPRRIVAIALTTLSVAAAGGLIVLMRRSTARMTFAGGRSGWARGSRARRSSPRSSTS